MNESDRASLDRPPGQPTAASLLTGFDAFDRATGGLPRRAVTELFGGPGTGKTTLALQIAARVQRDGGGVAWIDTDGCFDAGWAAALGLNLARLAVMRPAAAEEALEMARMLALSQAVDLAVLDSAAALTPAIELALGAGEGAESVQRRVLASGLRRLTVALRRSGAAALFLNQTRARTGPEGGEIAAGGAPLKLYASLRVALAGAAVESGRVRFRVRKNRAGASGAEGFLAWRNEAGFAESP